MDTNMSPYAMPGMKKDYSAEVNIPVSLFDKIISVTCAEYKITTDDIRIPTYRRSITIPRQTAWFIMNKLGASQRFISRQFDMHRTTVMSGIQTIQDLMDTEPEMKEKVLRLISSLDAKSVNPIKTN